MPALTPNKPFVSTDPVLAVGADLKPGRYLFRLEVEDDGGNLSAPAELAVIVAKPVRVRPTRIDASVIRDARVRVNPRILNPGRVTIRRPR